MAFRADTQQLIKVNALQVAPAELEDQLLKSNLISDAAVVGITLHDEEWPRAYVVLAEEAKQKGVTPKQIQDWFKPRVAKHKALVGGVAFVDEVVSCPMSSWSIMTLILERQPKLASGKIQRKVLKEWSKRDAQKLSKNFDRAKL